MSLCNNQLKCRSGRWLTTASTTDRPEVSAKYRANNDPLELRIFAQIGLRLVRNGLITVGLLSFVGAWNNFSLPLLGLSREELLPLTVGMAVWNQSSVMTCGQPVYTIQS
jgi:hypothetical protein